MIEVVQRLRIDARLVVFGPTHRAGPLSGDDRDAWRASTGARLINLGSRVYEPTAAYQEPGRSPYWPGRLLLLDEADPPRLVGLLDDLPAERWKELGA